MKCPQCDKTFTRLDALKRHEQSQHPASTDARLRKCHTCDYQTIRLDVLRKHEARSHANVDVLQLHPPNQDEESNAAGPSGIQAYPHDPSNSVAGPSGIHDVNLDSEAEEIDIGVPPADDPSKPLTDRVHTILESNRNRIRSYVRKSNRWQDLYNFTVRSASATELTTFIERIFESQAHRFKINVSLGFILKNHVTGELVYYYASTNNRLLDHPVTVGSRADIPKVFRSIEQYDLLEYCIQQRPNSKYGVLMITNALFYVNKIKQFPIGCHGVHLPEYLRRKRTLINFVKDRHGRNFDDNMCLFRCLAYHLEGGTHQGLERKARDMCKRFCDHVRLSVQRFPGVRLSQLKAVEDLFQLNIEVFTLKPYQRRDDMMLEGDDNNDDPADGECPMEIPDARVPWTDLRSKKVLSSRMRYDKTMYLNLFDRHFSLITNLNAYSSCWSCRKCDKLFRLRGNAIAHERNCTAETRVVFAGGGYGTPKTVFDLLEEHGIHVPQCERYYQFRLSFDFECLFSETPSIPPPSDKQSFLNELEPATVSVCSNVRGFTQPRCFVSDGDPNQLIASMYEYITDISHVAYDLQCEKYQFVLNELEQYNQQKEWLIDEAARMKEAGNLIESKSLQEEAYRHGVYDQLMKKFDKWLRQIVALGFNTGRFDINLIRQYLFPYLVANNVPIDYLVKRNNDYMSISTPHAVFLDIKNYLAAGVSYKQWLESYRIKQSKGFFPYEWFTSLAKLDETSLPPQEAFWSTIKQCGIADEDYEYLKNVWRDRGFQSMRDLIIWYNNLDVAPFLEAAEHLFLYWKGLGIDPFKQNAISLPGLALNYLMKRMTPHTILPLLREQDKEYFYKLKQNMFGGLAVVVHRYHECGITRLPNGKLVAWIYSLDCNSLYLWALGEKMGTGIYAVWHHLNGEAVESLPWIPPPPRAETEELNELKSRWNEVVETNMKQVFHRKSSYRYNKKELQWLEWYAETTGAKVDHAFNGRQKTIRVSRSVCFPVDGFISQTETVLQFHGCSFHGHGCASDTKSTADSAEARRKTNEVTQKIKSLGFTVIEMWECAWDREVKENSNAKQFLRDNFQLKCQTTTLTAAQILKRVEAEKLFGMVECDLEVPMWSRELFDYYEEFPPICKHAEISRDDIGEHMRIYAEANEYLTQPRKNLINSFWARKILLTTPILKWYLDHGLRVTRVYSLLEMVPKSCFESIRDEIVEYRRQADRDPALKSSGENWKTLGNSLYGKTVTNKQRHKDHMVVPDEKVGSLVNSSRFHKMEEVGEIAYEVSLDKKKIKEDLPVTVAFFVYNYAKLRQLQFVYDFLKHYMRPGSYQIVCSDTDSIIAAYENKDIDQLVKPHLVAEYRNHGKTSFLATDAFTKRTPGLYKEELSATGIVALSAKTYHAWNDEDGSTKTSSKGLSKKTNALDRNDFKRILNDKGVGGGVNYGFAVRGDRMFMYRQERTGLGYLYVKRRVLDDGISTSALYL